MEIYISIDGVLRNTLQKIQYHYNDYFLESDGETKEDFEYKINYPIKNDKVLDYFTFQSPDELNNFLFVEFPIEIFGHAGISYPNVFTDLNKLIYDNPDINFTVVGLDHVGKSRPATLFFLSKNGFLGLNIKFINTKDIPRAWRKCDIWVTDNKEIINARPKKSIQRYRLKKKAVKFNTIYNDNFNNEIEINKITEISELWLKSLENHIISI